MFVLVEHYVSDVQTFWSAVRHAFRALPAFMTLHHCIPTRDGSHAVCVWEAESIRDVKSFIESYIGHASRNLYFPVDNAAGTALPSAVQLPEEEAGVREAGDREQVTGDSRRELPRQGSAS